MPASDPHDPQARIKPVDAPASSDRLSRPQANQGSEGGQIVSSQPMESDGVPVGVWDRDSLSALSSSAFLNHLQQLGVELRAKDSKLQLSAPAGVLSAELQGELRRRKPELLLLLSNVDSADEERVAPLAFAQQRLWLLDRFSPGSPAYNIPQSWVIEDTLDVEVLREALNKLMQRHAALRTRIEVRNGEPMQIVMRQGSIDLRFTDLSSDRISSPRISQSQGAIDCETMAKALLFQDGREPFLLSRAPLIRFHLIQMEASRFLFSYCVHHIIADQWSLDVLKRDLSALYVEIATGRPAALPRLETTFADFADRERTDSASRRYDEQLQYWRRKLTTIPPLLELPFAASRPATQSDAGATLEISIDSGVTRALRDLAKRNQTSLYVLMLTVFQILLYRYTGQREFCIGTPISARKSRADEEVIGMFVNMLPLPCSLNPSDSLEDFLNRTRQSLLSDFENSDIPFQRLVTDLQPQRTTSHSPFFQFLFALNPKGSPILDSQQEVFLGTAKYDLTLQIAERADTLDVFLEYRTELYASHDIEQFGRHFLQLATSVAAAPATPIASLDLMTAEDAEEFRSWNKTALPFDPETTLISLFEHQCGIHPDAVALYGQERTCTYRELQLSSNRLAALLVRKGCGAGSYVGLCLDRTPDLIVSMLAILKTGAAYLPLDPRYPLDRLRFMLEDSGARFLIASRNELSLQRIAAEPRCEPVYLEDMQDLPAHDPEMEGQFRVAGPRPSDPAYLIYTSGSTGVPKGVIVDHGNAVALIAWARAYFAPELLRGVLASTSVCFDLSIFEIFLPLATGNAIVLVSDVLELQRSPHQDRVTLVNTVPSAMSALLQGSIPANTRAVCMAGEFLPGELVDRVYAAGVLQVFDLYGPTETTTYSTCTLRLPGAAASIGRPIANTRIYLLDENLSPVPRGAIGEIFIAGAGVTRGYLHRPELTAERFLSLPTIDADSKLYRTGDLARLRSDGELVYLGRRDQQVKLRGHRIELGEVEAALRTVSGSSNLAVIVQKRESGDALLAFVVPAEPQPDQSGLWMAALRELLPSYMLPSRIVLMDQLPLTPNGKIDRKALALLDASSQDHQASLQPPSDLLEQWIANIWAQRLGRKSIARNQNFFEDLGGHSLVAFEIFAEIESRLGVVMMLATLFQAPTVEFLAAVIQQKQWNQLASLDFAHPGWEEPVLYRMPVASTCDLAHLNSAIPMHPFHKSRVMTLRETSGMASQWTREIAEFEASRPPIRLIGATIEEAQAHALAASLAGAGFSQIDVEIV